MQKSLLCLLKGSGKVIFFLDNLCGSRMDHVVHSVKSTVQAVFVADIADKEPHAFVALELLRHVPLLHLVAGVDDNLLGIILGQRHRDKRIAERTCTASYQNRLIS